MVTAANSHRSWLSMVRILPKRYDERSGMKPGERKQQMMPTLMPKVQNIAIAESSLTSPFLDIHSTPNALATANAIADNIGFSPKYTPRPIPPNEAWVIPPLMNTKRRDTIYVPTMAHNMLASKLPSNAFWKNGY